MSSRAKVLIVEDNADVRRLYAIGLNQHGYEVKLASNGAEALDRIQGERPDLILLDLVMPIMDGWELIEKVNPHESATCIPVVVVTGQSTPPNRSMPACVVAWLTKPATIEEVVSTIQRVVPLRSAPSQRFSASEQTDSSRETRASR